MKAKCVSYRVGTSERGAFVNKSVAEIPGPGNYDYT